MKTAKTQAPEYCPESDLANYLWLANYLKVKPGTLRSWVHHGKIPHIKLCGSMVRFKKTTIDEWLKTQSTGTAK